jgi:glycopeptide antibiotics resistance protein
MMPVPAFLASYCQKHSAAIYPFLKRLSLFLASFCSGAALWDEWRQLTLLGRSADIGDLIFDGLGIFLGLLIARQVGKKLLPPLLPNAVIPVKIGRSAPR